MMRKHSLLWFLVYHLDNGTLTLFAQTHDFEMAFECARCYPGETFISQELNPATEVN